MKRVIYVTLLLLISSSMVSGQTGNVKQDLTGKWLFQAPYAPEGYKDGTIEVGYAEKKYSATMIFSVGENKFIGDKVRFENDTLYFNVFIEGQDVVVKLKYDNETKMTGEAVYNEGIVPLLLTKEIKKE
jgi:hypothetical protein